MGWFSKSSSTEKSSSGKDKSGSKGAFGKGYGKGSASSNSSKWVARTDAQQARSDKAVKSWKG